MIKNSDITKHNREKFFCDTMLGRLAKWLRLLGYDAAYESEIDDWELLRLAAREGRVLLTRDQEIMKRWQIARGQLMAFLLAADKVEDQLAEVRSRFGLEPRAEARCPEDNSVLEILSREKARSLVPSYVFETQKEFHTCPTCGRIYWKATHWERIDKIRARFSS